MRIGNLAEQFAEGVKRSWVIASGQTLGSVLKGRATIVNGSGVFNRPIQEFNA